MNTTSARKVSEFARILSRNPNGTAREVFIPGHEGRQYRVILRRENGAMTTECLMDLGGHGERPCQGNSNGRLCYHSLAAIIAAAGQRSLAFCSDNTAAGKLARMGGQVVPVRSRQGQGSALVVVR